MLFYATKQRSLGLKTHRASRGVYSSPGEHWHWHKSRCEIQNSRRRHKKPISQTLSLSLSRTWYEWCPGTDGTGGPPLPGSQIGRPPTPPRVNWSRPAPLFLYIAPRGYITRVPLRALMALWAPLHLPPPSDPPRVYRGGILPDVTVRRRCKRGVSEKNKKYYFKWHDVKFLVCGTKSQGFLLKCWLYVLTIKNIIHWIFQFPQWTLWIK